MGSFPKESKGGTSTANLLLLNSEVFKSLDIIRVDSTLRSIKNNFWIERIFRAIKRFLQINWILLFHKPKVALIFCGHGIGFIEKGLYVWYLSWFNVPSVFAPRSGIILANLKKKYFKWFAKTTFSKAKYIICQGNYWRSIFSNYTSKDKLQVIYNWLPLPEEHKKCDGEEEKDTFRLVYLGWLESYKGIGHMLNIMPDLAKKYSGFEFHLYGVGTLQEAIESFINEKNLERNVYLHPWINDEHKKEIYLNADALLFASKYEGMPNTILEAMSYGLPVIANGITSIPEVVKHKINGLLFFRNQEKDMLIQIESLINNRRLCQKLSKNAREQIKENHQVEGAAKKIVNLLFD